MESFNNLESNYAQKNGLGNGVSECSKCKEVIIDKDSTHCDFCGALFEISEPKNFADIMNRYELTKLLDYLNNSTIKYHKSRELKIRASFLLKKIILEKIEDSMYSLLFLELENILNELKKNGQSINELSLSIEKMPMNQAHKNCLNYLTQYEKIELKDSQSLKLKKLLTSYAIFMVILLVFYFF